MSVGRNEKCPCGSDLKYKHCCGKKEAPPIYDGVEQLLGTTVGELANPECPKCFGKGYTGLVTARDGVKKVRVPVYCKCIRKKFVEKYSEKQLEEAAIKKAREIEDAKHSVEEEVS